MKQGDLFPGRGHVEVLELRDAHLRLQRDFLSAAHADRAFAVLMAETEWIGEHAVLYGREVEVPRRTAWHGDPGASYVYSGVRHVPRPWTAPLRELRERVQDFAGCAFNSVLLNLYRDGNDSVSWHADDEPELGSDPVIASLSLGAVRTFQMKHGSDPDVPRLDLELEHGSLLVMGGACQRHWKHQVPKRRGRNAPGPRINLTFRYVAGDG